MNIQAQFIKGKQKNKTGLKLFNTLPLMSFDFFVLFMKITGG
jgi:hypothetical protein